MNITSNRDERHEAYYFVPESVVVVVAVGVCKTRVGVKMEGLKILRQIAKHIWHEN